MVRGHNQFCNPLPCAKDHRDRREKLEDVVSGKGVSEGERANARASLARMGAAPRPAPAPAPKQPYAPPSGAEARPAGAQARPGYVDFEFTFDGAFTDRSSSWDDFFKSDPWRDADEKAREALRQAQARETLRRASFVFPDDTGFETEFTANAADANAIFRKVSEAFARGETSAEVRDNLSKMSEQEFREWLRSQ